MSERADEYSSFLKYFIIGIVLVVASSSIGRIDIGELGGIYAALLQILLVVLTAFGVYYLIVSAKYYIHRDLKYKYEIHKWGDVRKSLDFFTKDSEGQKIRVPVSMDSEQLEHPKSDKDLPILFSKGVKVQTLGSVADKKVVYMKGNPGDKIGPFFDDEGTTTVFVVKGEGEQWFDDKREYLEPGDGTVMPAGVERRFMFRQPETEIIVIYEPVTRK